MIQKKVKQGTYGINKNAVNNAVLIQVNDDELEESARIVLTLEEAMGFRRNLDVTIMDLMRGSHKAHQSQVWLITDTHFNHANITKYCGRPEDYQSIIWEKWMKYVHPFDVVYHLGDVIFKNASQLLDLLATLPGRKVMIRGNHDKNSNSWYLQHGFDAICNQILLADVLLSHEPVSPLPDNVNINIHGHFHNNPAHHWEPDLIDRITDRHFLLSIEDVGYKPVLLEECRRGKHVKNTLDRVKNVGKTIINVPD